jgi:hypothetical protein
MLPICSGLRSQRLRNSEVPLCRSRVTVSSKAWFLQAAAGVRVSRNRTAQAAQDQPSA